MRYFKTISNILFLAGKATENTSHIKEIKHPKFELKRFSLNICHNILKISIIVLFFYILHFVLNRSK